MVAVVKESVKELNDALSFFGVEVKEVVKEVTCYIEDVNVFVGWCENGLDEGVDDVLCWGVEVPKVYIGGADVLHYRS